jgi:hypothetical protein
MYAEACQIELEHVKAGDYNFDGIGKPDDLWEVLFSTSFFF